MIRYEELPPEVKQLIDNGFKGQWSHPTLGELEVIDGYTFYNSHRVYMPGEERPKVEPRVLLKDLPKWVQDAFRQYGVVGQITVMEGGHTYTVQGYKAYYDGVEIRYY